MYLSHPLVDLNPHPVIPTHLHINHLVKKTVLTLPDPVHAAPADHQGHLHLLVVPLVNDDLVKVIPQAGAAVDTTQAWAQMTAGAGVTCLTGMSVPTHPQLVPVVRGSARNAGVTKLGCVTMVNMSGRKKARSSPTQRIKSRIRMVKQAN